MQPSVIIIGVAILIVGFFAVFHWLEVKRRETFRQLAQEQGFDYKEKDKPDALAEAGTLALFHRGRRQKIQNMLMRSGMNGKEWIFDFQYTTGSGNHQHTHRQTVFLFHSALLNLPSFEMRPENIFHKIGKAFGYQDINPDHSPEFSRKYLLRGADEVPIRQFFNPVLCELLEKESGLNAEGAGGYLALYTHHHRIHAEQFLDKREYYTTLMRRFERR